jgi:hypothetical protein
VPPAQPNPNARPNLIQSLQIVRHVAMIAGLMTAALDRVGGILIAMAAARQEDAEKNSTTAARVRRNVRKSHLQKECV